MSRALMFGGAFNPPTCAHIELADAARNACNADFVIFVPSKSVYIKHDQHKDIVFKDDVRYEMLQKIACSREWMLVSDVELNADQQPRSYYTLQTLQRKGFDVSLLMGSDKLNELQTGWKKIPEIAEEFGIVCMVRHNDKCEEMIDDDPFLSGIRSHIKLINTPNTYQEISSTKVRKIFIENPDSQELNALVPEELNGLHDYRDRRLFL